MLYSVGHMLPVINIGFLAGELAGELSLSVQLKESITNLTSFN